MWSNDKYVDQPELTFKELCRIEEQLREGRLLAQRQEEHRESRAMLCEDWVMIEKIFLKVQLDPLGGFGDRLINSVAFGDLAAGLTWLRAPSMSDEGILRLVNLPTPSESAGSSLAALPIHWKLPKTSDLQKELWLRRAEDPRCLWLYVHTQRPGWWRYVSKRERIDWGPAKIWIKRRDGESWVENGALHKRGWKTMWFAKPFPWVEMTGAMDGTTRLLRSRAMAVTEDQRKLMMPAWRPSAASKCA